MTDCLFCKIVAKEIFSNIIFEDEDYLAFLDVKPFNEGHTLLVPKTHYRWVNDVPNFGEYWEFARTVSEKLNQKLNPLFINYLTVGMDIDHAHIHVIPRYKEDSLIGIYDKIQTHPTPEQLRQIAAKINL